MCSITFLKGQNMVPNIQIFDKTISAYMIAALVGVLVMLFSMKHIAKKSGMDELDVQNCILISFIGVVLGGHLFSGIGKIYTLIKENTPVHINSFQDFVSVATYVFGGSVFFGGLIGAIIACAIYIKIKKWDPKPYMDIGAMAAPLFHCFGRIGCFLSGCCYGVESDFGFVYHYSVVEAANGVRRFPVQLVEAFFNLCLFFVIYKLFKTRKFKDKLLFIYLVSYSVARFILEFFRGDEYRGFIGVLSVSQFVALVIVFLILISTLVSRNKNKLKN